MPIPGGGASLITPAQWRQLERSLPPHQFAHLQQLARDEPAVVAPYLQSVSASNTAPHPHMSSVTMQPSAQPIAVPPPDSVASIPPVDAFLAPLRDSTEQKRKEREAEEDRILADLRNAFAKKRQSSKTQLSSQLPKNLDAPPGAEPTQNPPRPSASSTVSIQKFARGQNTWVAGASSKPEQRFIINFETESESSSDSSSSDSDDAGTSHDADSHVALERTSAVSGPPAPTAPPAPAPTAAPAPAPAPLPTASSSSPSPMRVPIPMPAPVAAPLPSPNSSSSSSNCSSSDSTPVDVNSSRPTDQISQTHQIFSASQEDRLKRKLLSNRSLIGRFRGRHSRDSRSRSRSRSRSNSNSRSRYGSRYRTSSFHCSRSITPDSSRSVSQSSSSPLPASGRAYKRVRRDFQHGPGMSRDMISASLPVPTNMTRSAPTLNAHIQQQFQRMQAEIDQLKRTTTDLQQQVEYLQRQRQRQYPRSIASTATAADSTVDCRAIRAPLWSHRQAMQYLQARASGFERPAPVSLTIKYRGSSAAAPVQAESVPHATLSRPIDPRPERPAAAASQVSTDAKSPAMQMSMAKGIVIAPTPASPQPSALQKRVMHILQLKKHERRLELAKAKLKLLSLKRTARVVRESAAQVDAKLSQDKRERQVALHQDASARLQRHQVASASVSNASTADSNTWVAPALSSTSTPYTTLVSILRLLLCEELFLSLGWDCAILFEASHLVLPHLTYSGGVSTLPSATGAQTSTPPHNLSMPIIEESRYVSPLAAFASYRLNPLSVNVRSATVSNRISVHAKWCRFELGGACRDKNCKLQHFDDIVPTDEQLCNDLLSYVPASQRPSPVDEQMQVAQALQIARSVYPNTHSVVEATLSESRSRFVTATEAFDETCAASIPMQGVMSDSRPARSSHADYKAVQKPPSRHSQVTGAAGPAASSIDPALASIHLSQDFTQHQIAAFIASRCTGKSEPNSPQDLAEILSLLARALELRSSDEQLWLSYFYFYGLTNASVDQLQAILRQAVSFNPLSLVLWRLFLTETASDYQTTIRQYESAIGTIMHVVAQKDTTRERQHASVVLYEMLLGLAQVYVDAGRPALAITFLRSWLSGHKAQKLMSGAVSKSKSKSESESDSRESKTSSTSSPPFQAHLYVMPEHAVMLWLSLTLLSLEYSLSLSQRRTPVVPDEHASSTAWIHRLTRAWSSQPNRLASRCIPELTTGGQPVYTFRTVDFPMHTIDGWYASLTCAGGLGRTDLDGNYIYQWWLRQTRRIDRMTQGLDASRISNAVTHVFQPLDDAIPWFVKHYASEDSYVRVSLILHAHHSAVQQCCRKLWSLELKVSESATTNLGMIVSDAEHNDDALSRRMLLHHGDSYEAILTSAKASDYLAWLHYCLYNLDNSQLVVNAASAIAMQLSCDSQDTIGDVLRNPVVAPSSAKQKLQALLEVDTSSPIVWICLIIRSGFAQQSLDVNTLQSTVTQACTAVPFSMCTDGMSSPLSLGVAPVRMHVHDLFWCVALRIVSSPSHGSVRATRTIVEAYMTHLSMRPHHRSDGSLPLARFFPTPAPRILDLSCFIAGEHAVTRHRTHNILAYASVLESLSVRILLCVRAQSICYATVCTNLFYCSLHCAFVCVLCTAPNGVETEGYAHVSHA
jgi:Putative zinc-finger domain